MVHVPSDVPDDAGEVDAEVAELEHIPAEVADLDAEELDAFVGHLVEDTVAEVLGKVRDGEVDGLGPTGDGADADPEQAVEADAGPHRAEGDASAGPGDGTQAPDDRGFQ